MTRIALVHALAHSVAPINAAMAQAWPEAVRMNLLDDSLSRLTRCDDDRGLVGADALARVTASKCANTCAGVGRL